MQWVRDDGGRARAGYPDDHDRGDCVTRAIAIALKLPYREVYDAMNERARQGHGDYTGRGKRRSAVTGMAAFEYGPWLRERGWRYVSLPPGATFFDLPMRGRLLVSMHRHLCCLVDGVLYDTGDCSQRGFAKINGYWRQTAPAINVIYL